MDVDDFVLSPNQILIQQGSPFRLEEAVRVISGVVYRHWRCCNLSSKWLTDVEFAEVLDEVSEDESKISVVNHLWEIRLDSNFLRSLPSVVCRFSTLERLSANSNLINKLPADIVRLATLRYLDLSNNQLTFLPNEIFSLFSLVTLKLNGNQLSSIQPQISQLTNLKSLSLSHNALVSLPTTISLLPTLWELFLNNNQISEIPASLGSIQSLKTLDISDNRIDFLPYTFVSPHFSLHFANNPWNASIGECLFVNIENGLARKRNDRLLLSLKEICARTVMKQRLTIANVTQEVLEYLKTQSPCHQCNSPLFDSFINTFLPTKSLEGILVQYNLCSLSCFRKLKQQFV